MIEIERKFRVRSNAFIKEATLSYPIKQGYLNSHKNRTVRVRLKGAVGYITVKGATSANGTSRFEWETKISKEEAEALLNLCEKGIIEKMRYEVPFENRLFEVDVFFGAHKGLVIAEVELEAENAVFNKPDWLGKEVTGNVKYYNSYLAKNGL